MTESFAAYPSPRGCAVLVIGEASSIGAGQVWVADAGLRMVPATGYQNIM